MSADELISFVKEELPKISNYPFQDFQISILNDQLIAPADIVKIYTISFRKRYRQGVWRWQFEKIE